MQKILFIIAIVLIPFCIQAQKYGSKFNTIYTDTEVEVLADFPDGEDALFNFIQDRVRLSQSIRDEFTDRYNTVVLSFHVDEKGKVSEVSIAESSVSNVDVERELKRVVRMLPDWIPAKKYEINVSSTMYIPIRFTIKDDFFLITNFGTEVAVVKNQKKYWWLKGGLVVVAIAVFYLEITGQI
ncbi:MAG: TonB family protein [Bacteroidales bacterium]|nr:TonB family protein [Bacteroidales bacterium]